MDVITAQEGMEDSFRNTTAVFALSRVVGEGRDMPRSMYHHTDIPEDQVKSYLEPDLVELGVLSGTVVLNYVQDNGDGPMKMLSPRSPPATP